MRAMRTLTVAMVAALLSSVWARGARAQPGEDTSLDDVPPAPAAPPDGADESSDDSAQPAADAPSDAQTEQDLFGIGQEFSLEARDRVISAARTETTIQEAPAIVTVITSDEIRDRGFRTMNEVLQSVPGFEGERTEGNGWITEAFARGNPRTVLVLVNGINVVEPIRNMLVLDRKFPLDIIDRVEIISGPGGVLWGSNAILGVVNITTIDASDIDGWRVSVAGGHGPGELGAASTNLTYGTSFTDDVQLLVNLNFYTSRGAELTVDGQKVVGAFPAPAPDGASVFLPSAATSDPGRDYFGSLYLNLRAGPVTANAFVGFEEDRRQLGFGGGLLTSDLRSETLANEIGPVDVETVGRAPLWLFSLSYRDRFADDDIGLSVTAYTVRWLVEEDPFGSFPPSDFFPRGLFTIMNDTGQWRPGVNIDADAILPHHNHLVFGAEFFADLLDGVNQTFQVDPQSRTDDSLVTETLVNGVQRFIGAVYLSDEWRASDVLALNAGARAQFSNTYDPEFLFAAAAVWNAFAETFVKLNYTEGFRPPQLQATDLNPDLNSNITFNPNPDLDVERSRAIEAELNTAILEDTGIVDRWFLRADYSFTILDDLIDNTATGFTNSGTRFIHSVELLSRLTFIGQHELSTAYYFVDVEDDARGPIRSVANHIVNAHGRVQLLPDCLHFSADLTWIGPREDANRRIVPGDDPSAAVDVFPSDLVIDQLDDVWLLRTGLRANGIADTLSLGVFGHNVLDQEYAQPDPFFDDRVAARPYPRPRWSIYATADVEF